MNSLLGCAGCGRPASDVGELRIYPPRLRSVVDDELLSFLAPRYCGPCAVRQAVANTQKEAAR